MVSVLRLLLREQPFFFVLRGISGTKRTSSSGMGGIKKNMFPEILRLKKGTPPSGIGEVRKKEHPGFAKSGKKNTPSGISKASGIKKNIPGKPEMFRQIMCIPPEREFTIL